MLDATPGHVRDVEQTVDAAEIQEGAVVGQVLDDTLDLHAFFQVLQQGIALGAVFLFHHGAAGDDDIVALAVELDDLEFLLLAFEVGGVAHRAHIHQANPAGRRERCPGRR
jgi:hypothetical protein